MRRAALALVFVAAVALGWRISAAAHQCFFPAFAYSAACFAHDVMTGEDL